MLLYVTLKFFIFRFIQSVWHDLKICTVFNKVWNSTLHNSVSQPVLQDADKGSTSWVSLLRKQSLFPSRFFQILVSASLLLQKLPVWVKKNLCWLNQVLWSLNVFLSCKYSNFKFYHKLCFRNLQVKTVCGRGDCGIRKAKKHSFRIKWILHEPPVVIFKKNSAYHPGSIFMGFIWQNKEDYFPTHHLLAGHHHNHHHHHHNHHHHHRYSLS